MLTQHRKRAQAARPDKPQYPDEFRKLTVVRALPVRPDAEAFIREYEYLGKLGASTRAAYGLFTPWNELLGVECFGVPPTDMIGKKLCPDDPSLLVCLERGGNVPWAPRSSALRLIKHAIEQAHRDHGWEVIVAYADENAGEIGGVYRGDSNWLYLGRDLGRGGRPYREAVIRPGESVPSQTRNLRKSWTQDKRRDGSGLEICTGADEARVCPLCWSACSRQTTARGARVRAEEVPNTRGRGVNLDTLARGTLVAELPKLAGLLAEAQAIILSRLTTPTVAAVAPDEWLTPMTLPHYS